MNHFLQDVKAGINNQYNKQMYYIYYSIQQMENFIFYFVCLRYQNTQVKPRLEIINYLRNIPEKHFDLFFIFLMAFASVLSLIL